MKEKKNIERIFQEKFKHFEAATPTDAWKNISNGLYPEKKKRRIIPFWLKLSGIASVFLLGTFFLKDIFIPVQPIEVTKTDLIETPVFDSKKIQNTDSGSQNGKSKIRTENTGIELVGTDKRTNSVTTEQIVMTQDTKHNHLIVVSENKEGAKPEVSQNHEKSDFTELANRHENKKSDKNSSENSINQKNNLQTNPKSDEELFAESELVQQELDKLKKLKEEPEENQTETASFNKWKITPNVAPVTMNSLTQGSSVSSNFIENSKETQTTLSYGMGFSYAVSKKFNIRTGVNKVSVGYNTNDVEIYAATDAKDMLSNAVNINFNNTSENIVVRPENLFSTQSEFSPSTGKINQQIGFIEVPVELSYRLLDSRFGIELIGGMSTLFLNENEISVISNGMSTVLGEASNLNDVHFSTNLGIGFKYEIFKSFEASLEPIFKYQLGAFSKNDGNFKPYILGLYTGLSFKF